MIPRLSLALRVAIPVCRVSGFAEMRAVANALVGRVDWEFSEGGAERETKRPRFLAKKHANWRCLAALSFALVIVMRPFLVLAGAASVAVLLGGMCSVLLNVVLRSS